MGRMLSDIVAALQGSRVRRDSGQCQLGSLAIDGLSADLHHRALAALGSIEKCRLTLFRLARRIEFALLAFDRFVTDTLVSWIRGCVVTSLSGQPGQLDEIAEQSSGEPGMAPEQFIG
jgi:hypothetical protein